MALTAAIASVGRRPARMLKGSGSIPTAANPVITPLAAPAIAAAAIPLAHTSTLCILRLVGIVQRSGDIGLQRRAVAAGCRRGVSADDNCGAIAAGAGVVARPRPRLAAFARSKMAPQVLQTAPPGLIFSPQPGHSTVSRGW